MERLQAAIEKARAQREGAVPATQRPGPAWRNQASPSVSGIQNAWAALEEVRLQPKSLQRKRITSFEGGKDSAPYDMLRTRMLQQAKVNGWRRIAIVSPHSDCGKSTTAANLAFSLARQPDLRSMVFDFDLRRSGLTKILDQNISQGMYDVLEERASFADHGRRFGNNVAFGFNRGVVQTPSEILQSPRTKEVLDKIETAYAPDLMLFDMPPLMASDDNFGFLHNVDAALIMVAAEKTTMSQIDVAERHVAELTNVMGLVLNKCRYTNGAHGYEYDYY